MSVGKFPVKVTEQTPPPQKDVLAPVALFPPTASTVPVDVSTAALASTTPFFDSPRRVVAPTVVARVSVVAITDNLKSTRGTLLIADPPSWFEFHSSRST